MRLISLISTGAAWVARNANRILLALAFAAGIAVGSIPRLYIDCRGEMERKDKAVQAAWVRLRSDLIQLSVVIPKVVETVRALPATQKPAGINPWVQVVDVTASRATEAALQLNAARLALIRVSTPAQGLAAYNQYDSARVQIEHIVESYPDLACTNEDFGPRRAELAAVESRINASRDRYNQALEEYNGYLRRYSRFARWAGFQANPARFDYRNSVVIAGAPRCVSTGN